jgi:tRNA(adenine34) deaminase
VTTDPFALALDLARRAARVGEVPIGAVITCNGRVIAKAHNMREHKQNAIYHAEVLAIMRACKKLKSWRLDNCEMYVTLEPCPMCRGAITNARIKKVYYGAKSDSDLNWTTPYENLENAESQKLLRDFFKSARQ